jgi:predicted DCC family thiol-disulfide oxidoreductase YuxK
MSFWLLFVPAGAALSLDALRRKHSREPHPTVRAWHLGLLQAQLVLVYLSTFLLKMGNGAWHNGEALANAWQITFHARPWSPALAQVPGLSLIGTWSTRAFELAFAVLVWNRRLRPWLLTAGVFFHLGIDLTLRAGPFSAVMLACYLTFVPATTLRRWAREFIRLHARLEFQRWQFQMLRKGKWVVYYNGDCGFCQRWVVRARRISFCKVQWKDFQQYGAAVAHLHPRFSEAAYLVIDDVYPLPGFQAFRKLIFAMPMLWPLLPVVHLPGARSVGDALYRYISVRWGPVNRASSSCSINTAKM